MILYEFSLALISIYDLKIINNKYLKNFKKASDFIIYNHYLYIIGIR